MVVTYRNTRTGRLAEVDDDKLVALMDRSTRWQRADGSLASGQEIPAAFDPSEHGVREVRAYLADADDAERERVLGLEAAGKARSSLLRETR